MYYLWVVVVVATLGAVRGDDCDDGKNGTCVMEMLKRFQKITYELGSQLMEQQLYLEEKTRSDGDSGVKQVRSNRIGTNSYHADALGNNAASNIHDHANYDRTPGLGEFVAVLNGVEFRTRHNDYKVVKAAGKGSDWGATEEIDFPPVPDAVLNKDTVDEQVTEMRKWFEAFNNGDYSERDYRKHFKPCLCYLEGVWTYTGDSIDEPFPSDRHQIDASSWKDLNEKVRFTSYAGRKGNKENFSYLPTCVADVSNTSSELVHAQWNYRILCQSVKDAYRFLEPSHFVQVDDIGVRMATQLNMEDIAKKRTARFMLKPFWSSKDAQQYYTNGILDQLMGMIPGRDGQGAELHDEAFDEPAYHVNIDPDEGNEMNVAYYHRSYKVVKKDAMGGSKRSRGFSDKNIFMARTTSDKVVPSSFTDCVGKGKNQKCKVYTQKWTYAIPLEIIYLTPLSLWNPYGLEMKGRHNTDLGKTVTAGGRNGGHTLEKAWNGTNSKTYYLTPETFYKSSTGPGDAADTGRGVAGVLDKTGTIRRVVPSGIRTIMPDIEGVGKIRQRYPIMPVHCEGSAIYKEVEALKQMLTKSETFSNMFIERPSGGGDGDDKPKPKEFETSETIIPSSHVHSFMLAADEVTAAEKGHTLNVETEEAAGHTHNLKIKCDVGSDGTTTWKYTTCDGKETCWDQHPHKIIMR